MRTISLPVLVILGLLAFAGDGAHAQKKEKERDPLEFWFDPRRAQPAAVVELVAAQNPFTIMALRIRGHSLVVWGEPEFAAEEAPDLNRHWLTSAGDRDGKPMPDFRGKAPDEIPQADKDYYRLVNQALINAFWTAPEAFAKSAKPNENVTFSHMYNEIWKYRGKVVPVKGHLRRLYERDTPIATRQAFGIKTMYEGWIALPTYGTHPICVWFPILPEGLKPAGKMNTWVEFNGYVINLYRYTTGEKDAKGQNLTRKTPFLIGPTVKLAKAPPAASSGPIFSPALLYGFVGFVAVVVLFVICLNLWFRRGDQRIRDRLNQLQAQRTVEMMEHPQGLVDETPQGPGENDPVVDQGGERGA